MSRKMSEVNFIIIISVILLLITLILFLVFSPYFLCNRTISCEENRLGEITTVMKTCSANKLSDLMEEIFREKKIKIYSIDEFLDSSSKQNDFSSLHSTLILPCGYTYLEAEMEKLKTTTLSMSKLFFGIDGCDLLVSKNLLWHILQDKYSEKTIKQWIPKTYILSNSSHIDELIDTYKNSVEATPPIIFKKNIQRKEGLLLTNSPKEILQTVESNRNRPDGYVVAQEFISNTLKVYGHKLNMRIYLLAVRFAHSDHTQFYLHSYVKCIYTNMASHGNSDMRLEANITSLNLNKDYIYGEREFPIDKDDLARYLLKETPYTYDKDIWHPLVRAVRQTTIPFRKLLGKNSHYSSTTRFQLFGGDIIFEEAPFNQYNQLKPLLLEFNKGPDMSFSNSREKALKKQVLEDSLAVAGFVKYESNLENKNFLLL